VNSDIFDRPSPRMVDGLEILARILHPECFEESEDNTP
jgi:iron complex transport system substrate-binding protein